MEPLGDLVAFLLAAALGVMLGTSPPKKVQRLEKWVRRQIVISRMKKNMKRRK